MADDDKNKSGKDDTGAGSKSAVLADLARERDKRQSIEKELKAARDELTEAKREGDTSKSEMQKLTEAVNDLRDRLTKADLKALRAEVAAEKKLTAKQAKRIQGSTREELEADADELLEDFGMKSKDDDDSDDENDENDDDGKGGADDKGGNGRTDDAGKTGSNGRGRPKEKLRSGAASSDDSGDDIDPSKIADKVLDTSF